MRALVGGLLAVVLGASGVARAEDLGAFETEGTADTGVSDPKTAALDESFQRAVTLAVVDVVDAQNRKTFQPVIEASILNHARLWVKDYKITNDATAGNRRTLDVRVRVDRDKIRAKLSELQVPVLAAAPAGPRSVAILLRVTTPDGVIATYGPGASGDTPGIAALASALRDGGLTVKKSPVTGEAARADGDLPLRDDEAVTLAADTKVEQLAIAGVTLAPPAHLRGVAGDGVLATASLRLIARADGSLIGQGAARTAAVGDADSVTEAAAARALAAAASDVVAPKPPALSADHAFTGEDEPAAAAGSVLVRMPAKTPWALVAAEQKYLSGAKGVTAVSLRRISAGGWILGVTTAEAPERVAQLAKKGSAKVKVVGGIVEVTPAGS